MARARYDASATVLNKILGRERIGCCQRLCKINWHILKCFITQTHGPPLKLIRQLRSPRKTNGIMYTNGYLITKDKDSNQNKCLNIYSISGTGHRTVQLPGDLKDQDFAVGSVAHFKDGRRPHLYFITERELISLDVATGRLAERVLLPVAHRYTSLDVDHERGLLTVASAKSRTKNTDVLMAFALLEFNPLHFVQLLQMKKSVYGRTLTGAEINQGLLLTLHADHRIKIYSLDSARDPTKVQPGPVLLDTVSYLHQLCIGGSPPCLIRAVHYNDFQIRDVADDNLLRDGVVTMSEGAFDCRVGFYPDESSRLVAVSLGTLRIFEIVPLQDESADRVPLQLILRRTYNYLGCQAGATTSIPPPPPSTTTASGRTVLRRSASASATLQEDTDVFLAWDYEDDLDVLGLLFGRVDNETTLRLLHLDLVDAKTGLRLRRNPLDLVVPVASAFHSDDLLLRLDATHAIVSIGGCGGTRLFVFQFKLNP